MIRVKIVHGNDAGSIHEYDDPAAQSLLDSGFAVLVVDEPVHDDPAGPPEGQVEPSLGEPVTTSSLQPSTTSPPPEPKKGAKAP